MFSSPFLQTLHARGLLAAGTDLSGLDAALVAGPVTAYAGFDATAPSLHVGHLLSLRVLRLLAQTGHTPIVVLGGGTTLVGDPTGRSAARPVLTPEAIAANSDRFKPLVQQILGDVTILDNRSWLGGLSLLDFLRDVASGVSVNVLSKMDTFARRLTTGEPLSMLEFFYPLLQAYDFAHLAKSNGCTLQVGGSDQWGNIVAGVEMGRKLGTAPLFGLTTPLLTTASGEKMGKSQGKAVWLDASLMRPFDFWQFWRNVPDAEVEKLLLLFTDLPVETCQTLGQASGQAINTAKARLATAVTALVHGDQAAQDAALEAQASMANQHSAQAQIVAADLALPALLVDVGFAASNKAAKRLIQEQGVRLDGTLATLDTPLPTRFLLSAGKKRHLTIERR